MRSEEFHQQPSPTFSTIVWKFRDLIIINIQRIVDKHVLENKFKIGKTTDQLLAARIQNNIVLWDYI